MSHPRNIWRRREEEECRLIGKKLKRNFVEMGAMVCRRGERAVLLLGYIGLHLFLLRIVEGGKFKRKKCINKK